MFQPVRRLPNAVSNQLNASRLVLAEPHARAIVVSSLVARLPNGMVPLATVLLLRETTGSYAIAGVTAALVALGDAATTPVQGRLVDRFGRGRVLLPTATVHVAAVVALLLAARVNAPADVLAMAACIAGVGMPPISGTIKALWPLLVEPGRLPAAYVMESLLQQLFFLCGPLVVAAVTALSGPGAALGCSAVMVAAGTAGFVMATASVAPIRAAREPIRGAMRIPAVRILVGTTLLQSITFGGLPVGLAAIMAAAGNPDLAGVVQAALTVGGVAGTFGPRVVAAKRRYVCLVAAFAVALTPVAGLAAISSAAALIGVAGFLIVAGLLLTPIAATSYLLVEKATTAPHRTEAFAWLSTGQGTGNAAGAAIVGMLTDEFGAALGLATLPIAVGAAALLACWRLR